MITTRYLKQNLPRKHTGKTFFYSKAFTTGMHSQYYDNQNRCYTVKED